MSELINPVRNTKGSRKESKISNRVKKKIEKLRQAIRHHDYLYYVLAQPEISDNGQYDLLNVLTSSLR